MTEYKKSFIIYTEWFDAISELSIEEQAEIFRIIFLYHKEPNSKIRFSSIGVKLVWKLIHPHFSRNSKAYDGRSSTSRDNGNLGGRPKNLTKPKSKPNLTYNNLTDNVNVNVNVNDINSRKEEFKNSLHPYLEKYNSEILNEFYSYWTEHGEKDRKMRFEKEKSFGVGRRLSTWKKNENKFTKKRSKPVINHMVDKQYDPNDPEYQSFLKTLKY